MIMQALPLSGSTMAVDIMPAFLGHVLADPVILLGNLQQPHIHIHHQHAFFPPHLTHGPDNGERDAGRTEELLIGTRSIHEDNCAGILEAARRQRRLEEERFRVGVV